MSDKTTYKVGCREYEIADGNIFQIYNTGRAKRDFGLFLLKTFGRPMSESDLGTVNRIIRDAGIKWTDAKRIIKKAGETSPNYPFYYWKTSWRCSIGSDRIMKERELSRMVRSETEKISALSKFGMGLFMRSYIKCRFNEAVLKSENAGKLYKNIAAAGKEITTEAIKRQKIYMRKELDRNLRGMIERELVQIRR